MVIHMKSFSRSFFLQKTCEFFLLSFCLSIYFYVGTRLPDPSVWGIFGSGNVNIGIFDSIISGLAGSGLFFILTAYPLITYLIVTILRRLINIQFRFYVPVLSSLSSLFHVVLLVEITGFKFLVVPFWIITAVMMLFILLSSTALYPKRTAPKSRS